MNPVQRDAISALGLGAAAALGTPLVNSVLSQGYYKRAEQETGLTLDPKNVAKRKALLLAHAKDVGSAAPSPMVHQGMNRGGSYQFSANPGQPEQLFHGPQASQFVLAHELGHRAIDLKPGLMQQVQQRTYSGVLHPLIETGAQIAAGAFAPSTRRALAYGLSSSYLNQLGTLASEVQATREGSKYLAAAGTPISPAMHAAQLSTYGVGMGVDAIKNVAIGRGLRALAGSLK